VSLVVEFLGHAAGSFAVGAALAGGWVLIRRTGRDDGE
jgi:hypothetical protein